MSFSPDRPPYLTADHPGTGGRIKVSAEDFRVEEIPAYDPCGSGDHLFLKVEKTEMGAEYFLRRLAERLGISNRDIGCAGLKDRHAVTVQWVSVPKSCEAQLGAADGDGIRVLNVSRHANKLRAGHLRGNRFDILIRDADRAVPVGPIASAILGRGLPNYYGLQRFGRGGETGRTGLAMIRGEQVRVRNPFVKKLSLSAGQSWLFNDYLSRRSADGLLWTVLPGDVMAKWPAGGMFTVTDPPVDQARADAREIVSAGPMFGAKTFPSAAIARDREQSLLDEYGLVGERFQAFGKLLAGTRRRNLIYLDDLSAEWESDGLRLRFTLPSGSYATVLLREFMKAESTDDDDSAEEPE